MLLFGNGGSAADAQHIAAELVIRYKRDRAPIAAIALSTDTSALTAGGNDLGFEAIFERQVEALGRAGGRRARHLDLRQQPQCAAGLNQGPRLGLEDHWTLPAAPAGSFPPCAMR